MADGLHVAGRNKLLSVLPPSTSRRVESYLDKTSFALKQVLYEPNQPIEYVYFPLTGVLSNVLTMSDGGMVEVGTIGNEGLAGTPVFLDTDSSPTRMFCQVPGEALRMPLTAFREELDEDDRALQRIVARYTQALMSQIAQSVACNHLHSVEQRTCRWLLVTHDRVGTDEFPMTQEFLSAMLAVRRPSVTIAAGLLEKAGLITYRRGRIRVLDRARLDATSCECYHAVKREYERLLGEMPTLSDR